MHAELSRICRHMQNVKLWRSRLAQFQEDVCRSSRAPLSKWILLRVSVSFGGGFPPHKFVFVRVTFIINVINGQHLRHVKLFKASSSSAGSFPREAATPRLIAWLHLTNSGPIFQTFSALLVQKESSSTFQSPINQEKCSACKTQLQRAELSRKTGKHPYQRMR